MFDEIRFNTIERLPNYVFAEVNAIKMAARRAGEDIIDFSMGNPEGRTPQHIVDKKTKPTATRQVPVSTNSA